MHKLTEKKYATFKAICAEKGIQYETEAEYEEASRNLLSYVLFTYDLTREHYSWEQRPKDEPKGFWLDSEGLTCYVCHTNVHGQICFDKWGAKVRKMPECF